MPGSGSRVCTLGVEEEGREPSPSTWDTGGRMILSPWPGLGTLEAALGES